MRKVQELKRCSNTQSHLNNLTLNPPLYFKDDLKVLSRFPGMQSVYVHCKYMLLFMNIITSHFLLSTDCISLLIFKFTHSLLLFQFIAENKY